MSGRYTITSIFIACTFLFGACSDDLTEAVGVLEPSIPDEIVLDGCDQYYVLQNDNLQNLIVVQGDFITTLPDGRLYIEQNDDGQSRRAEVKVTTRGGDTETLHFVQRAASRGAVSNNFVRHHGVGYSFDAVNGRYCDLSYLRCQVLNRAVLRELSNYSDVRYTLIEDDSLSDTEDVQYTATSLEDYIHRSHFSANADAQIVMFSGDVSGTIDVFEQGTNETYIRHEETMLKRGYYHLELEAIKEYTDRYPNLLTSSFRHAVEALGQTDDRKSVDDFIDTYGTHIVTTACLGAKLSIDVQIDTKKYYTVYSDKLDFSVSLSALWNHHGTSSEESKDYTVLKDSKCRVDVLGGDVSIVKPIIGMTSFGQTNGDISEQMVSNWMNSVKYDTDDLANSNVELIDMEVTPIWELIADKTTADRVQTRIEGNAALMQQLLGNRNFINTSFPATPKTVTCRIGQEKQSFDNPDVVDIICSNRYIATVCHELVPEISKSEKVWVAYPIYEGYVKLTNGLCLYNDSAYSVSWMNNRYQIQNLGYNKGETIYMTLGMLGTNKANKMEYQKSYPVLGCERPGGIDINGNLAGQAVQVCKWFGHFYLLDNTSHYDNIPNWSYEEDLPPEAEVYPQWIDGTYRNRMRRNDDYVYIWNPTEIGYYE